jgi:hypothetical protein
MLLLPADTTAMPVANKPHAVCERRPHLSRSRNSHSRLQQQRGHPVAGHQGRILKQRPHSFCQTSQGAALHPERLLQQLLLAVGSIRRPAAALHHHQQAGAQQQLQVAVVRQQHALAYSQVQEAQRIKRKDGCVRLQRCRTGLQLLPSAAPDIHIGSGQALQ